MMKTMKKIRLMRKVKVIRLKMMKVCLWVSDI